jgi:hypothetical protein
MIQFLADNVDQLDLTLDQLAIEDRNFDRFALVLIDNVVELTLHKFAQDKASENKVWGDHDKSKYDPKIINSALGQNFDAKVKAAHKLELIDGTLCESILNLHSFRNTTYHKGLRHERILHSLAIFYFRNTCTLLKSYEPMMWIYSASDQISHRAIKYLGNQKSNAKETFNAAYDRLDVVAATMKESLVSDLSDDMFSTIKSIDDSITFLSQEGPDKKSRDEVVVDAQAWPFAFTEEAKVFASSNGFIEGCEGGIFVDWIVKNYDWLVKRDPVPSWNSRLDALRKEKDYHKALKKYCDFMRQTDDIRFYINEAAVQLDSYIQQQADAARGK